MSDLRNKVSALLGRDAEVEKLKNGKYIVLWLSFSSTPPPVGDTEEMALENFINWYKEDTNGRSDAGGNTPDETNSNEDRATEVPS